MSMRYVIIKNLLFVFNKSLYESYNILEAIHGDAFPLKKHPTLTQYHTSETPLYTSDITGFFLCQDGSRILCVVLRRFAARLALKYPFSINIPL